MGRSLGWVIVGLVGCGGTSGTVAGPGPDAGAVADEAGAAEVPATEEPDRIATTDGTCNALLSYGR